MNVKHCTVRWKSAKEFTLGILIPRRKEGKIGGRQVQEGNMLIYLTENYHWTLYISYTIVYTFYSENIKKGCIVDPVEFFLNNRE